MGSVADRRRALAALAAERHREGRTARLLRRSAAGCLLLVLVALPVLWALGFFSTPPAVAELRRLVDEQVAELDRVARGEVPYDSSPGVGAVFEKMREVPRTHRQQVERDMGRLWEARERAETGSYFSLSPEQREAELDRRIRAEDERRRQWEAERAQRETQASGGGQRTGGGTGGGQAGGGPPRSTSDEARLARSKQRIDGTTPDERARRAEYRRAIDERRERMGLPNGGPRRSG